MGKVLETVKKVWQRRSRQYDLEDFIERQKKRGYVGALQEVDGTPMAPPVGFTPHEPLALQIRRMVMSEHLRIAALQAEAETFEEADDFDIPDDPVDPKSPYENDYEPSIKELLEAGKAEIARKTPKAPPASSEAAPAASQGPEGRSASPPEGETAKK